MAKIFVAEDDERLASCIKDWLEKQNHLVETALDGGAAVELLELTGFDLLILDWDLPKMTGIEICRVLRAKGSAVPILMLTGKGAIEDKELGFDAGADDYLTKPFHVKELTARVRALLRRPEQPASQVYVCGRITLDALSGRVTRDGELVEILPREFALLQFFISHPDQVFSLEALQARVWTSDVDVSFETIRAQIAKLRTKIESPGESPLLRTVQRRGYMLETPR